MRWEDLLVIIGPIGIIISIISTGYAVVEKLKNMHIENSSKLLVIAEELKGMRAGLEEVKERLTFLERRQ